MSTLTCKTKAQRVVLAVLLVFVCSNCHAQYSDATSNATTKGTNGTSNEVDSSSRILYAELKGLTGKSIFCNEMQAVINKAGKNPMVRIVPLEAGKGIAGRFEYYWEESGLKVSCDSKLEIESCTLSVSQWKGELPLQITKQDTIDVIKRKCGIPDEDQKGLTGVIGSFVVYNKLGLSVWFDPTAESKNIKNQTGRLIPRPSDSKNHEVLSKIIIFRTSNK